MNVTVRLYATLRDLSPGRGTSVTVDLVPGATIADVVKTLGIPDDAVRLAFVDGIARDETWILKPGDEIGLFPPIAGGV
jgi:molybdopterin converting factor small subunit